MTWRPLPLLIALATTAGVPGALRAQEGHTQLGFELGYSRARFAPSALTDAREGSLIGGFIAHGLGGPVSAQGELLFTTKGGALNADTPFGPARAAVQLVYIEVPVLLRITLPLGGSIRPLVLGGGSYAISVGCEFQVDVPGAFGQTRCDQAGSGLRLFKSDVSAIAGGGVEYRWRSSTVRLELRRFIGLRNVIEGSEGKNRSWVVLAAVTF